MSGLGAVDHEFVAEYVHSHLGADRDDALVGPRTGGDFGALEVGGTAVAVATNPIVLAPSVGFERAGWFAVHQLLGGVALAGIPPAHLTVDFNLPPGITDEQFRTVWETFDAVGREFGVAIATGHTGRYDGCAYPMVGAGTAIAIDDGDRLVRPDGASVGDRVVVTKGPAVGATGLLASQDNSPLAENLPADTLATARNHFDDASVVRDALTAAAAGPVTAMHVATDRGVFGGLRAMADAADVRIEVETNEIPVLPGVRPTCDCLGIDPWWTSSPGTLLATVDPSGVDDVLAALDDEGIPAADAGEAVDGSGLVVDGSAVDPVGTDPFWTTMAELFDAAE